MPQIGNSIESIEPHFKEIAFNLTNILGSIPYMALTIDGKINHKTKYIGFGGITLGASGSWIVNPSSFVEL